MRNIPLNVRGGRAPQVGDRTFEGRTSAENDAKPQRFSAIAWSPGPFPAVELWCYRTTAPQPGWLYQKLAPVYPHDSAAITVLWLDSIPDASGFVPPPGFPADSMVTQAALVEYATLRFMNAYNQPRNRSEEWSVHVARPYPYDFGEVDQKIAFGAGHGSMYQVQQSDQTGPLSVPLAYVWVTEKGGREVWLLFDPNQPGGFRVVGDSAATEILDDTKLVFRRVAGRPPWVGGHSADIVGHYADAILGYRKTALATEGCPAYEIEQLIVHDWRVMPPD